MSKLISECNDLLKDCGLNYAFCGGYALELFLGKTLRSHSDVDTFVFDEDKATIIRFVLNKGWNVYEHRFDWIDNRKSNSYLRSILSSNDESIPGLHGVWAIKPDSSLIKVTPIAGEGRIFEYEIMNGEQLNFDFFEIIFNQQQDGGFICDKSKGISRELNKAILSINGIPYLAPEVILFIISDPAYLKSDYHKVKNQIDFNSTLPFLSGDSREWLIDALVAAYPEGLERLPQIRAI